MKLRPDRPRGLLAAAGDGAVLLMLLSGTLLGVISVYGLPAGGGLLEWTLLLGLAAWGIFQLPRFRWCGVLIYGGILAWQVYRNWASLCLGALLVLERVTTTLAEELNVTVLRPVQQVAPWMAPQLVTLWLLTVAAAWALLLGWAAARRRCWWLSLLLTLGPILPGLLAGSMPSDQSFLLLVPAWCALLLLSAVRRAEPRAAGKLLWIPLAPARGVLLVIQSVSPSAGYVPPAWAVSARGTVLGWFARMEEDAGGSGGAGGGTRVDLSAAGPLAFTGRTMLQISDSDLSGRVLLRGSALGVYTGDSWEQVEEPIPREAADVLFYPAATVEGEIRSMVITKVGARGTYGPYQPVGPVQGSYGADGDRGLASEEDSYRAYFSTTAIPWNYSGLTGEAAAGELAYRTYVREHYLEVPAELEDCLMETLVPYYASSSYDTDFNLPEEFAGPIRDAQAVTQLLADLCTYDPDTPLMPEGEDFVSYFLTESHRGYCMHFASAGVLLLRQLGVPARYVTGYAAEIPSSGSAQVPDEAAHAWVEIYLDGYGWYPVDVTPAYEEDTPVPDGGEDQDPVQPETPETPEEETPEPEPTAPEAESPRLLWGLVLAAALLAALPLRRWTGRALRRRGQKLPPNRSVICAYRYQERLIPWGAAPSELVRELGGKARFSQHTLTEAERQAAWAAVLAEARETDGRLPWWKRLAFRWLWGLY